MNGTYDIEEKEDKCITISLCGINLFFIGRIDFIQLQVSTKK